MSGPVLLFGGTTEGRRLSEWLSGSGIPVLLCVATAYGEQLAPADNDCLMVHTGRLSQSEMEALIQQQDVTLAVDATHPYAEQVSINIRAACGSAGIEYIRVVRSSGQPGHEDHFVADVGQAVQWLIQTNKTALLAVGSKELTAFTAVPDYQSRLYARVLPDPDTVLQCHELGFRGRNLIAMQGPFSQEMNVALLRDLSVEVLVTKESGAPGGWEEKTAAAREAGVHLLVIRRPSKDEGISYSKVMELLSTRFAVSVPVEVDCPKRFPLFVDLRGKQVVMVGGGRVATRRAEVLTGFGARITVIAPEASTWIRELAGQGTLCWITREFQTNDLANAELVVAATSQREVNQQVGIEARAQGIPVSVADAPDEGSFWFPSVAQTKGLVVGLVSADGNSHGKVKKAAAMLRKEAL